MSDEELRALERRWHETGAVEDEARWHTARVRHGLLSSERLELAAWLGSPAAAQATGLRLERGLPDAVRYRRAPLRPRELMAWARGLDRFGVEVARRALLADVGRAVGASLRAHASRSAPPRDDLRAARAWVEAALVWLRAPESGNGARRLERCAEQVRPVPAIDEVLLDPAVELVEDAALVLRSETLRVGDWWPVRLREDRSRKGGDGRRLIEVHTAISAALVPWALGLRDPLEAREAVDLDRVEVASPCPLEWDGFTPTADPAVRRCEACHLDVLDLSALSRAEAEARLAAGRAAGGGLCVSFYRRPDGRVLTADCVGGLARRALPMVQRGMMAF